LIILGAIFGEAAQVAAPPVPPVVTPSPTATNSSTPNVGTGLPPLSAAERRMFEALNAERRRQGLTPVAWSAELGRAAALHSADMASNDFLEHEGSDGSAPWQRAAREGYVVPPPGAGWMVIETISARPSMAAALDWLLTDGLHRRVLLRSTWREVGIGYFSGGRYGNYWTLDFGCRANVLPAFANLGAEGQTVALTFSNEECTPTGGGPTEMGRATEFKISNQREFKDARWEPFVASKSIARPASRELNVLLRDGSGRLSAPVRLALDGDG
jgi:uncharacterized protein YkwD